MFFLWMKPNSLLGWKKPSVFFPKSISDDCKIYIWWCEAWNVCCKKWSRVSWIGTHLLSARNVLRRDKIILMQIHLLYALFFYADNSRIVMQVHVNFFLQIIVKVVKGLLYVDWEQMNAILAFALKGEVQLYVHQRNCCSRWIFSAYKLLLFCF